MHKQLMRVSYPFPPTSSLASLPSHVNPLNPPTHPHIPSHRIDITIYLFRHVRTLSTTKVLSSPTATSSPPGFLYLSSSSSRACSFIALPFPFPRHRPPSMLPVFHIRDTVDELGDIQLSSPREYDDLIVEQPVATLGYVDDDDGEVITVCRCRLNSPPHLSRELLIGVVFRSDRR